MRRSKPWPSLFLWMSVCLVHTASVTDRQTDRQTDRHSMPGIHAMMLCPLLTCFLSNNEAGSVPPNFPGWVCPCSHRLRERFGCFTEGGSEQDIWIRDLDTSQVTVMWLCWEVWLCWEEKGWEGKGWEGKGLVYWSDWDRWALCAGRGEN